MKEETRKKLLAHIEHIIDILKTSSFTVEEILQWNENTRKEVLKIDPTGEGLALYDEMVEPKMYGTLDKMMEKLHGEDHFKKLKEDNKKFFNHHNNPLRDIENPTLDVINNNWQSFYVFASEEEDGHKLISKYQNFAYEQILEKTKNKITGTYNLGNLKEEWDKYNLMLSFTDSGEALKAKLGTLFFEVIESELIKSSIEEDLNNQIENVKSEKNVIETEQKIRDLWEGNTLEKLERVNLESQLKALNTKDVTEQEKLDKILKKNTQIKRIAVAILVIMIIILVIVLGQ
jgi:hypothetical protein